MWTNRSRLVCVCINSKIQKQDKANVQAEGSKPFDCSLLRTGRILGRPEHKKGTRMFFWV